MRSRWFLWEEDGLLHTACGTPNYVAPELAYPQATDSSIFADLPIFTSVIYPINLLGYSRWASISFVAQTLPNSLSRITISEILQDEWFRKDYQQPRFAVEEDENPITERREKPVSMNAFELISGSQGFSLENLIKNQSGTVKRETRFTSPCSAKEIVYKIEAAAKSLYFDVDKQNYKVKQLEGRTPGCCYRGIRGSSIFACSANEQGWWQYLGVQQVPAKFLDGIERFSLALTKALNSSRHHGFRTVSK
ncbi:hypothetical protein V2J09_008484 [Rumex salicifolius]